MCSMASQALKCGGHQSEISHEGVQKYLIRAQEIPNKIDLGHLLLQRIEVGHLNERIEETQAMSSSCVCTEPSRGMIWHRMCTCGGQYLSNIIRDHHEKGPRSILRSR